MRHDTGTYLFFPGAFAPVLSIDALTAQPDADGFNRFDIADESGVRLHAADDTHVIGAVGSTGKSTGAHLHYEVRIQGRQVNPAKYLVDR